MRDGIALIYLLVFIAPQAVLYVYLRDRLPNRSRPRQARIVRWSLILLFAFFNFPWIFVARRVLFGSVWSKGWIPYIGPWVAWQMLGWVFLGLVAVYVLCEGAVLFAGRLRRRGSPSGTGLTRRQFLNRGTYAYAGAGFALSAY